MPRWLIVLVAPLLVVASPATAPRFTLLDRLPADTARYTSWRGDLIAADNHLATLWNDPASAPLRHWVQQKLQRALATSPELKGLPAEKVLQLLAHSSVVAGSRLIEAGERPQPAHFLVARAETSDWQLRLNQLVATVNLHAPWQAQVTDCGVLVAADHPAALRELVQRFGCAAPSGDVLASASDYQSARQELGPPATLETYADLARTQALNAAEGRGSARPGVSAPFASGLFVGQVDLSGATTKLSLGLLGQPVGANFLARLCGSTSSFATTLSAASDTASFLALYPDLHTLRALLAPIAAARAQTADRQGGLGLDELLGALEEIFTGEVALLWQGEPEQPTWLGVAALRRPEALLQLLGSSLATAVIPDAGEGSIHYFHTSASIHGPQGNLPLQLAVTPSVLIVGQQATAVRQASQRVGPTRSLGEAVNVLRFREHLPTQLFSLFSVNLPWVTEAILAPTARSSTPSAQPPNPSLPPIDPTTVSHHLHRFSGGSWRDVRGFHLQAWVD